MDNSTKSERHSLKRLLSSTQKRSDFQRIQCVWLRIELNMKADMVAQITHLQPGTVRKIWSDYNRYGEKSLLSRAKGGRRNYHLSEEEEKMLLSPFFKKDEETGVLVVSDVKLAYENIIGKKVPKSTIYRLLSRHGWQRKRRKKPVEEHTSHKDPSIREYWIDGCSQALHPDRTGNISQQWLNSTLNSMRQPE